MSLEPKKKAEHRVSLQERVLQALIDGGVRGRSGEELAQITWRFGGAIHALRQKGWAIATVDQPGTDVKRYVVDLERPTQPKQDDLFPELDGPRPQQPRPPAL